MESQEGHYLVWSEIIVNSQTLLIDYNQKLDQSIVKAVNSRSRNIESKLPNNQNRQDILQMSLNTLKVFNGFLEY